MDGFGGTSAYCVWTATCNHDGRNRQSETCVVCVCVCVCQMRRPTVEWVLGAWIAEVQRVSVCGYQTAAWLLRSGKD